MEFKQALQMRQSIRSFRPEQIPEASLELLLEAANAAPICMRQFDHACLIPVQSAEVLDRINRAFAAAIGNPEAKPTYGAPTVIYICNLKEDEEIIAGANAACIAENMLLQAADLGLGGVFLFGVSQVLKDDPEITSLLRVPEGFRTVAAVAVGYPAESPAPREPSRDKIRCAASL